MSVASTTKPLQIPVKTTSVAQPRMPFLLQVFTLTKRNIVTVFRTPAEIIPSLIISVFFLAVFQASLGGASNFLPGLSGKSYLGFILPFSVVSAALSGAGVAGQSVVRDITNGYFDKLLLTPVSRAALLLSAIFGGAFVLGLQAALVMLVGLASGLRPETGALGLLTVMGFALLIGTAFAGFTVGVALQTGSPGATQGASFLFFPLSFLTATFVPLTLLTGWLRTAAELNPITYILDAMRTILNTGWTTEIILRGLGSALALSVLTYTFAVVSLRARTRRK